MADEVAKIEISNSIIDDLKKIIDDGLSLAYKTVNNISILTYWNVGKRIVEEEQNGEERAEYGKQLLKNISKELIMEYGDNYSERNLRNYRQFYLRFKDYEIWYARVPNLSWTHFRVLIKVESEDAS